MAAIRKITFVGMGALGLLFADLISRSEHAYDVSFVMDAERYDRYRGREFSVNGRTVGFRRVRSEDAVPADLVIFAVKYPGLEAALDTAANSVGPETVIISLLNGVTSEKIIGERFGAEKVITCVAQGMDANRSGGSLTYSSPGELHLGILPGQDPAKLEDLCAFLEEAGISYVREQDIRYRLWFKFMLNVAVNQVCMIYDTDYSGCMAPGLPRALTISAMREVIALAGAEGVALGEEDIGTVIRINESLGSSGKPSMGQDRDARRPSEVEMFSGAVIAMAKEHGIPVPVNEYIHGKVREIESSY